MNGTLILFPISPMIAVVGSFEFENGEHQLDEEEVAWLNGIIISNAQRQVYARSMEFTYKIDQSKPSKQAAQLSKDDDFKASS